MECVVARPIRAAFISRNLFQRWNLINRHVIGVCLPNQHPKRTIEKKDPQAFAHLENFSQNVSAMFYNHTILFVLFSLFWIVFGLDYNRHSLSRWNGISQNNIDVLTLWRHADSRWRRPSMNFIFSFLRTVTELTTKNDTKVLDYEWLSVWKQHQWKDGVPLWVLASVINLNV